MRGVLMWLACATAVGCLLWSLWSMHGALSAAEATIGEQATQIEQLRASQARTAAAVQAIQARSQVTRQEVSRALDAVPEYRSTVVPPAVVDSLCRRLRCAK